MPQMEPDKVPLHVILDDNGVLGIKQGLPASEISFDNEDATSTELLYCNKLNVGKRLAKRMFRYNRSRADPKSAVGTSLVDKETEQHPTLSCSQSVRSGRSNTTWQHMQCHLDFRPDQRLLDYCIVKIDLHLSRLPRLAKPMDLSTPAERSQLIQWAFDLALKYGTVGIPWCFDRENIWKTRFSKEGIVCAMETFARSTDLEDRYPSDFVPVLEEITRHLVESDQAIVADMARRLSSLNQYTNTSRECLSLFCGILREKSQDNGLSFKTLSELAKALFDCHTRVEASRSSASSTSDDECIGQPNRHVLLSYELGIIALQAMERDGCKRDESRGLTQLCEITGFLMRKEWLRSCSPNDSNGDQSTTQSSEENSKLELYARDSPYLETFVQHLLRINTDPDRIFHIFCNLCRSIANVSLGVFYGRHNNNGEILQKMAKSVHSNKPLSSLLTRCLTMYANLFLGEEMRILMEPFRIDDANTSRIRSLRFSHGSTVQASIKMVREAYDFKTPETEESFKSLQQEIEERFPVMVDVFKEIFNPT